MTVLHHNEFENGQECVNDKVSIQAISHCSPYCNNFDYIIDIDTDVAPT